MRLRLALEGRLQEAFERVGRDLRAASETAVRSVGLGLRDELRAQVLAAGLGTGVARAWRLDRYGRGSGNPAAWIWTKAPAIVDAFDRGVTIRARGGGFLAVPTPAVPRSGRGGARMTPELFERQFGVRLVFVYRRRGPSLLVAPGRLSAGGRFRSAVTRTRAGDSFTRLHGRTGGLVTVVAFILLPQTHLSKRLDVEGARRHWSERLPAIVNTEIGRALADNGDFT